MIKTKLVTNPKEPSIDPILTDNPNNTTIQNVLLGNNNVYSIHPSIYNLL